MCTHKSTDNDVHRCLCSVADVLDIQKCHPCLEKCHSVEGRWKTISTAEQAVVSDTSKVLL